MNRSELSRLLAKCLAHLACGNIVTASGYARALMNELRKLGLNLDEP